MAPLRAARGFRGVFLIESTELPGEIISITWWDSAEQGQAYLASPECREVIESVQEYLIQPLERSYYTVHIEASSTKRARLGRMERRKIEQRYWLNRITDYPAQMPVRSAMRMEVILVHTKQRSNKMKSTVVIVLLVVAVLMTWQQLPQPRLRAHRGRRS